MLKPITLYKQIQEWCKSLSINLPDMNPLNILYGIIPLNKQNILLGHLIMLYKITVYKARGNEKLLSLKNYHIIWKIYSIIIINLFIIKNIYFTAVNIYTVK